jgi:hypothetical protein
VTNDRRQEEVQTLRLVFTLGPQLPVFGWIDSDRSQRSDEMPGAARPPACLEQSKPRALTPKDLVPDIQQKGVDLRIGL